LFNFETKENKILYFKTLFDINVNEIKLLKYMVNTETLKGISIKEVYVWIKWLNRELTIFKNILIILKSFVTIPVTSCGCKRAFSKLSVIKTKLRFTNNNKPRAIGCFFIYVYQTRRNTIETGNITYDEVIEEFKHLIERNRRIIL